MYLLYSPHSSYCQHCSLMNQSYASTTAWPLAKRSGSSASAFFSPTDSPSPCAASSSSQLYASWSVTVTPRRLEVALTLSYASTLSCAWRAVGSAQLGAQLQCYSSTKVN